MLRKRRPAAGRDGVRKIRKFPVPIRISIGWGFKLFLRKAQLALAQIDIDDFCQARGEGGTPAAGHLLRSTPAVWNPYFWQLLGVELVPPLVALFHIAHQLPRALAVLGVPEMRKFAEAFLNSGSEHFPVDHRYVLEIARNAEYISQVLRL